MRRFAIVSAMLVVMAGPVAAQQKGGPYQGRRLADALQSLQSAGIRIVFSSNIVTPEMRVVVEPRAGDARRILDELLEPHHLEALPGPGGVLQIVRKQSPDKRTPRAMPKAETGSKALGVKPPGYTELVTVSPLEGARREPGVAADTRLSGSELRELQGVLVDDPLQTAHALPRVANGDDFRSEFSVRGSPYRHVAIVIDGVETSWLQHTVRAGIDSGSVAMLNAEAVEQATLQTGAYPRRDSDALSAQLTLTTREGSRVANRFAASVTGTTATLTGEGPLGHEQRGSWLIAVRRSYLDWPTRQLGKDFTGTAFGFADLHAKAVYDVNARQQLQFSVLGGRSTVDDGADENPTALAGTTNGSGLFNAGWRWILSPRTVVMQRAHFASHLSAYKNLQGERLGSAREREWGYRADLTHALPNALLEAGGRVVRRGIFNDSIDRLPLGGFFSGTATERSGYLHLRWKALPNIVVAPGVRAASSTLSRHPSVAWWLLGEWSFTPRWSANVSGGSTEQLPDLTRASVIREGTAAPSERAAYIDAGIQHELLPSLRWQITVFRRTEKDILRDPDTTSRLVDGIIVPPALDPNSNGLLNGRSRGVEVLLERPSPARLTGWIAYSYGATRYVDPARRDIYWADFDQRHSIGAVATYRLTASATAGARFRAGSGHPIAGYLEAREEGLYVGAQRNRVRLPPYARLDVHGSHQFVVTGRRLTLYLEAINVLNHHNRGPADGFISNETGRAFGFTEELIPRRISAGLRIELRRGH